MSKQIEITSNQYRKLNIKPSRTKDEVIKVSSIEAYDEYLKDFELLSNYFSYDGWNKFCDDAQDQMYDPSDADTYEDWLDYEETFGHQIDREVINAYQDKIEKLKEKLK